MEQMVTGVKESINGILDGVLALLQNLPERGWEHFQVTHEDEHGSWTWWGQTTDPSYANLRRRDLRTCVPPPPRGGVS